MHATILCFNPYVEISESERISKQAYPRASWMRCNQKICREVSTLSHWVMKSRSNNTTEANLIELLSARRKLASEAAAVGLCWHAKCL
jgi:hypothetical protein